MVESNTVKISLDGKDYKEYPLEIMKHCRVVSDSIENVSDMEVDLSYLNIEARIFDNVVKYLEFVSKNQPPKISKPLLHFNSIYEITLPWYANFANSLSEEDLCGTLYTAHRLQMDPLIDLLAARLAILLNPMSIDEKRKFFGAKCDFTEKEL